MVDLALTESERAITEAHRNTVLPLFDLDSYKDKTYLTHNIHPYPAKFVPQIPRALIENFCPAGGVVLDPFCGSGTALLEAGLLGRQAIGADLNPLAVLISRAKAAKLTAVDFRELRLFQSRVANDFFGSKKELGPFTLPEFRNRAKWFTDEALNELAFLKSNIDTVARPLVKNLLLVCFSAIIVKASNQESDTRWKAVTKKRQSGDAVRFFLDKLDSTISRAASLSDQLTTTARVEQTNAKDLFFVDNSSIDFVVTSPPYMNSYDYYLYHKLRMFWIGFDHYAVQESEIGSRNRHSDNGHSLNDYLGEIQRTMVEAHRVLKRGAYAAYVIGDSILLSELIEMDEYYRKIAKTAGLNFCDQFTFDQRRYTKAFTSNYKSQVKRSYILLFQAN